MSSHIAVECTQQTDNEELINKPDIWPKLATSLVNSICNGPGQYIAVPRLGNRNEAFLPLQVCRPLCIIQDY